MSLIIEMKVTIVKEEREPQLKSRRKYVSCIYNMIYVDLAPIAVLIWTVVVRNGRWTTGSANGKLLTGQNRTARLMKILFAAEVTSPCRYHYF
jgi:hypothetical protein